MNKPLVDNTKKVIDISPPDYLLDDDDLSPRILVTPRMVQDSGLVIALKSHCEKLKSYIDSTSPRLQSLQDRSEAVSASFKSLPVS